jgi:serralysin
MAKIDFKLSTDMTAGTFWDGYVDSTSSSQIVIWEGYIGGDAVRYKGSGFKYNSYTVVAGTVTSFEYAVNVQSASKYTTQFTISQLSLSAVAVRNMIDSYNYYGLIEYVASGNDIFNGSSGADTIIAFSGDDIVNGNAGSDNLVGGEGNDTIDGGKDADLLIGGAGNDTYVIDHFSDSILEYANEGFDLLKINIATVGTYTLVENLENATLTNKIAFNLFGNDLNNTLTGNAAANVLNGGAGNDTMVGGKGNDTYYVDATGDVVTEAANAGTDAIITTLSTYSISALTNIENLSYTGSSDAILTGNALVNTLTGSSGNDALTGGLGNDILTGGSGADSFVFDTVPNASKNKDTITDFVSGIDHIKFSKVIFTGLGASVGNLTSDQFWSGPGVTKAHDLDDRIIYNSTTGALYYDADGSGKGATVQVALIGTSSHPALAYTDIVII